MQNAKEKLGYKGTDSHAQRIESILEQIAELNQLRKQGIVTDTEFQAKKKNCWRKCGLWNGLVIAISLF
jgi:hypothetical protein